MQYSIGKVSKLLGLSVEGIRKYEKSGIISSDRDDSSNYRKYSYLDIASLIRAKMYRSYGFSLKETQDLTNNCSLDEIAAAFKTKESELSQDILLLTEKIHFIEEQIEEIRSLESITGKVRICRMPAIYRMEFSHNGEIDFSDETVAVIQSWMEYAPFVFFSSRYSGTDVYGGLAIRERYAGLFHIPEKHTEKGIIRYLPSSLCLMLTVKEGDDGYSHAETLSALKEYASKHNFEISDDIIGQTITGVHKSSEYIRYRQVFASVRDE